MLLSGVLLLYIVQPVRVLVVFEYFSSDKLTCECEVGKVTQIYKNEMVSKGEVQSNAEISPPQLLAASK